jgi:hypothetical protein
MPLLSASDPRPVHFVGIAGAGMSALAELFVRRGPPSPAATRSRATWTISAAWASRWWRATTPRTPAPHARSS